MKITPLQTSFSSGELSQLLSGRIDLPQRTQGLEKLENMFCLSQGPAKSKGGSIFLSEAKVNTSIRNIPFDVPGIDGFNLELGASYMRIHNTGGRIDTGGLNLIKDNKFHGEDEYWDDISSGPGAIIEFLGDQAVHAVTLLNGSDDIAGTEQLVSIITTGVTHTIRGSNSGDGSLRVRVGTTPGAGDIVDQTLVTPGDFSYSFDPGVTTIYVSFVNVGANATTAYVILPFVIKDGTDIEYVTPYTISELDEIQFEMIEGRDELIIVHSNHPQKSISYDRTTQSFTFADIVFTSPPADWTSGNYPGCVTTHQGRLIFARTNTQYSTIYLSKSGSLFDFTTGTNADDSFQYDQATTAKIEWIKGQKQLLVGTQIGEYVCTANNIILQASDFQIDKTSGWGSAKLKQPVEVGEEIMYVSKNWHKLRAAAFDADKGWQSPDIVWHAEHITRGNIKEIYYIKDPYQLIICVFKNGTGAICSYNKEVGSAGWSTYNNTKGKFISISAVEGIESSILFNALKQTASNKISITYNEWHEEESHMELDSSITRPIKTNNIVDGLDHLEGETITITVDKATHADKIVSNGQVTLDSDGNVAIVGLGYVQKMITMPFDAGAQTGSGMKLLKHWNKIFVRVLNSALPKINGTRPPERSPSTPMDTTEPIVTQDVVVSNLGRDRFAQITIEQDLPLSLVVVALFGELSQEGL